jgi:hypothetical protein
MVASSTEHSQIRAVRPEHGGRLELKLAEASATTARYVLSVFTPEGDAISEVAVDSVSGLLEVAVWQGTQPPAWLEALARAILRTAIRNKQSDGAWPRRITRWRPEPRA